MNTLAFSFSHDFNAKNNDQFFGAGPAGWDAAPPCLTLQASRFRGDCLNSLYFNGVCVLMKSLEQFKSGILLQLLCLIPRCYILSRPGLSRIVTGISNGKRPTALAAGRLRERAE